MTVLLKQSTAVVVSFGPAVLFSDGVTYVTNLVGTGANQTENTSTGIRISKNGGALAARHATATASSYDAFGMYLVTLDTTDTGTLGVLRVTYGNAAAFCPLWQDFMVVPANIYDSIVGGSDVLDVSVIQLLGTAWLTPGTAGTPDVNAKLIGATTQTGRDIGASVLLSTGTGTGQLDFTSGVVKANATQWLGGTIPAVNVTGVPLVDAKYLLGTIFATPATAGILDANVKNMNNVAATAITTIKAVQGLAVDGVITTLTNLPAITANWLTAAGIAAAALNGKGDWSTVTPINLTAAQIATGIFQDTTAGDFTVGGSVGKSIMNGVALGTGLTVARCTLTDTLTTYTGNTPQTGDTYALANGASGFVVIAGYTDSIESRLPAALVGGKMDSVLGAITVGVDFSAVMKTSLTTAATAATPTVSIGTSGLDSGGATAAFYNAAADALLDRANALETGITVRLGLRYAAAALAGVLSGAATTSVVILGANVGTTRITATVDASGNRSAISLT